MPRNWTPKIINGGGPAGPVGGDGGGGDMSAWQQSVENRLTDLSAKIEAARTENRTEFRWTWALLVALVGGLAGAGFTAFIKLNDRLIDIFDKLP